MTPGEKLDKLVDEFCGIIHNAILNGKTKKEDLLDESWDCMDIVIDETIQEANELDRLRFWTQVKDELWQRRKKK